MTDDFYLGYIFGFLVALAVCTGLKMLDDWSEPEEPDKR
jgi:hypothetical protein